MTAISPTDVWAVGGLGNGRGGDFIWDLEFQRDDLVPGPFRSNDLCPSRTASRMSNGRLPPDQGRSDGEAASITALAKFLSQVI